VLTPSRVRNPLRALVRSLSWGLAAVLCAGVALAQEPAPRADAEAPPAQQAPAPPAEGAPGQPNLAALEARRAEVAAERAALAAQAPAAPGAEERNGQRRIAMLERLEGLLARQIEALHRQAEQAERRAALEREIAAGPQAAIAAEPPYGLAALDQVLDAQEQHRAEGPQLEAAVRAAEERLAEARRVLDEREAARRAAKEAAGAAQGEAALAEAQRALRLAELASEVARARVAAEELTLANARTDLEIHRQAGVALAARVSFVEERLAVGEEELGERLAAIERREFALRAEQQDAQQAVESAERRLAAAQKRADAEVQPGPALVAEVEARRLALRTAQRRKAQIEEELERLGELRRLWQGRVRVLTGEAPREERRAWERELPNLDADRERDRRLAEARLADLERERAALAGRVAVEPLAEGAAPPPEQRWIAEQLRTLEQAIALARAQLEGIAENDRASRRLARALGVREEQATFADRAADALDVVRGAWSKELVAIEDNSITIGKVVTAFLLFALGIALARAIARTLGALARRRSALDEGAINAIQSLVFYALLGLFFLFALHSVNIPLTAFTVAGGAIAIGIGFGSQAIVNNFVSGLILMIERPIKVGDLIVYADTPGRVEKIGPRSTRIRTLDNVHLIVPNSRLLENNVFNWTLGDDVVRTRVAIGVTYGTPTREVEKLLLELMDAQPEILKHPRPLVLFEEFAGDALRFQAEFSIKLSPLVDERVVRSNLRHAIDEEFRRRGIVLAYPPRDAAAHLATPPGVAGRA